MCHVIQAEATQNDPHARAYLARPSLEPEPYQVLQDVSQVNTDMAGDSYFASDSDDDIQVYHTPEDDDSYFMDMATGRYMEGQGDGYLSPSSNSHSGGHVLALTAGPDQEPAQASEQDPEVPRDQYGYSQQDHDDWNFQHGASRPPPPTLEHNLKYVSGSDGGYSQLVSPLYL